MRVQLLSDVHLEFHKDRGRAFVDSLDPTTIDVLILAGDIAVADGIEPGLALFCARYAEARVLYVHGNHEFFHSGSNERARTMAAERAHSNRCWLDCDWVTIDGQRFIGAPMWFVHDPAADRLRKKMSEFSVIRDFSSWVFEENARAVEMLEHELKSSDVVITHHLPATGSITAEFTHHPLNPFFLCDQEPLIAERQPQLWCHGHTHSSVRHQIGQTTVLANPFGYVPNELNPDFEDACVTAL